MKKRKKKGKGEYKRRGNGREKRDRIARVKDEREHGDKIKRRND